MADTEMSMVQAVWEGLLTLAVAVFMYMTKRRDQRFEGIDSNIELQGKETSRLELLMSREYATKESLRLLFQETQSTNRDTAARLEKQIDETKGEIKSTNIKIDQVALSVNTLGNTILTELAKKT